MPFVHSRQRFGATAVAAVGGIKNSVGGIKNSNTITKVKQAAAKPQQHSKNSHSSSSSSGSTVNNPAKLTPHSTSTSLQRNLLSESKTKALHETDASHFPPNHDVRHSIDTKTANEPSATATAITAATAPTTTATTATTAPTVPAPTTADYLPSDDDIVIHVCDESRKVNRDFKCSKKLLLKEMKYFESYLSSSNQYDDIDISVHCDVYIFEWLMRFINRPDNPPELKSKSAVSILISSEFLKMQRLVDLCLQFVHSHINEGKNKKKEEEYIYVRMYYSV